MRAYVLTQLGDRELLTALKSLVVQDRVTTAALLAHIAEIDARRLYLPAGYPSMFEYCVRELHMSEQAVLKRIGAARIAREFPAIFTAVAEGRLHMSAVVLLRSCLTSDNADELITASTHKTKSEIEHLLAQRFPKADLPTRLEAIMPPMPRTSPAPSLAVGPVQSSTETTSRTDLLSPGSVEVNGQLSPGIVETQYKGAGANTEQPSARPVAAPYPRVKPLSAERFALQVTVGKSTHDKLRHAQALLGHRIPSGDLEQVLDRALDSLIKELEKKKFAATARPRTDRRAATGKRTIPAHVKREVWTRDKGQCTFVGTNGKRCPTRARLEFDHIDPVARGGQATVEGMRLLCQAHNQHEAECTFGDGFMHEKREQARGASAP